MNKKKKLNWFKTINLDILTHAIKLKLKEKSLFTLSHETMNYYTHKLKIKLPILGSIREIKRR